jgi:Tfp pilus assembly protein PilN
MRQYINLYRSTGGRAKAGRHSMLLLVALGLVLLVGLGAAFLLDYQAGVLEARVAQGLAQKKAAEQKLTEATRRLAGSSSGARVQSLEARLKERENLLSALNEGKLGDMEGYSEYLRALGRRAGQGVWITGFSVARSGAQLGISGRALDGERIPAWLRGLNSEKVFQGKSIAALKARRSGGDNLAAVKDGAPAYVEFMLGSELVPESGMPGGTVAGGPVAGGAR